MSLILTVECCRIRSVYFRVHLSCQDFDMQSFYHTDMANSRHGARTLSHIVDIARGNAFEERRQATHLLNLAAGVFVCPSYALISQSSGVNSVVAVVVIHKSNSLFLRIPTILSYSFISSSSLFI